MGPPARESARDTGSVVTALILAALGALFVRDGVEVVSRWQVISGDYALCGVLWIAAGAAMIVGGIWATVTLGRHRLALWVATRATVVAGATALIGKAAYVIPCAGPS